MTFNKNDILEVDIDAYGNSGEGVAHPCGYTLFVVGALVGERVRVRIVKANKNYGYGKLIEVLSASPERVEPRCPVAAQCGGCDLQHMSYKEQLKFKVEHVYDCLTRIGGVGNLVLDEINKLPDETYVDDMASAYHQVSLEYLGCEDSEWNYRNKAQFPIGISKTTDKPFAGFFASRSHRIVESDECYIQQPVINSVKNIIINQIIKYINNNPDIKTTDLIYNEEKHTGWLRHIYVRVAVATGQTVVCLVVNADADDSEYIIDNSVSDTGDNIKSDITELIYMIKNELLKDKNITSILLNFNPNKSNIVLGDKYVSIYGPMYMEDMIGDIRYRISPASFYQVNSYMTKKLYDKALEYASLNGDEVVWDLYCGIGTISLFLAQKAARVIGVETVQAAVDDATMNARINFIDNAEFICGTAEDVVELWESEEQTTIDRPDVIIIDPPRKGCDEKLINTIGKILPRKVVYVSCDPATLSRDIKRFSRYGYNLKKACVVDQFWQCRHIECAVQLEV